MKTIVSNAITARILAIVLMATVVISCSKKSDPSPADAVVGNWKLSGLLYKEDNDPEEDIFPLFTLFFGTCFNDLVFSFNANGTLTTNNPASCRAASDDLNDLGAVTNGKWELNGTKMSLIGADGTKDDYDYTLSGDVMSLVQTAVEKDPATNKNITVKTTLKFKKS
jgi:Lipocalin-like domain